MITKETMNIETFLRSLNLPRRYHNTSFIIQEKIKEERNSFFAKFKKCDETRFSFENNAKARLAISEIADSAAQQFNLIEQVLSCYENANLKAAQELFDTIMLTIENDMFVSTIDDHVTIVCDEKPVITCFRTTPGYRYFRVRPVAAADTRIDTNPNELFHLPLTKRQFSNNERFSLCGFPSLYLSTMLPLAWQECGYPPKYYYSEYQYIHKYNSSGERLLSDEFKFVSLYSPIEIVNWGVSVQYNNFDLWINVVKRYLKTYPLILACSFINHSGKVPYKQEYIVPQMLMQWVYRSNKKYQGISYFSCLDMSSVTDGWCAYNIAIPTTPTYTDGYSDILRERFNWTKPTFYSVPTSDSSITDADKKTVDSFINEIYDTYGKYHFPMILNNQLRKILNALSCLQSVLESSASTNMLLVLHMLSSISDNFYSLRAQSIDDLIQQAKTMNSTSHEVDDTMLDAICIQYKNLFHSFYSDDRRNGSIDYLIDKYQWATWNDLHGHSHITIICEDPTNSEVQSIIRWLKAHHILYCFCFLSDNNSQILLKNLASYDSVALSTSLGKNWSECVSLSEIKKPILIKQRDTSILSPTGTKSIEFVCLGYDEAKLTSNAL